MPGTALSTSHEVLQKHAATAPVTVSLAFSKEVSKASRPMATSLICVLQHGRQLWSKTKRCKILAALRKTSLTRAAALEQTQFENSHNSCCAWELHGATSSMTSPPLLAIFLLWRKPVGHETRETGPCVPCRLARFETGRSGCVWVVQHCLESSP
eukprot:s2398_g15.t1